MKHNISIGFLVLCTLLLMSAYFPFSFNNGTGIIVTRNGNNITFADSNRYRQGWALYRDTTHKVGTPQLIANGATDTLDNTADSVITLYLPQGVTSLYNAANKTLLPNRAGDAYVFSIRLKAKNAQNQGFMTVEIVAGTFASQSIAGQTVTFRKGVNVEQSFQFAFLATIRGTPPQAWIKVTADDGALQLYDMEYTVIRIMRGP